MSQFFASGGQSIGASGLISFRIDWLDFLAVQGTLKSLLQCHSSKASIFQCSAFFMVQLSHTYMPTGKTIHLTRCDFPGGSDGKASVYNAGDPGSSPGLGRSPGEGNGNPGKSHGQRSLVGYSLQGRKESDTTERLHFTSLHFIHFKSSLVSDGKDSACNGLPEMATHSSILAWRIPWTGRLQSMGSHRVRHD